MIRTLRTENGKLPEEVWLFDLCYWSGKTAENLITDDQGVQHSTPVIAPGTLELEDLAIFIAVQHINWAKKAKIST